MGILRAFGFGTMLVILAALMPTVFGELTRTIVVFLESSQQAFTAAGVLAGQAGHLAPLR